jgi:hypothetical protein
MYEEKYIRLNFLKLLYLNGLYRSYVQLGNHNLFIAAFPYFILRERGKNHRINKYQKIFNHIGCEFFSNKDLLHTIYKSQKELFPNDYNFMKKTYLYPEDKEIILKKFGNYKINKNNLWIVKPKNGNTGKGVHLFKNLEEESPKLLGCLSFHSSHRYLSFPDIRKKATSDSDNRKQMKSTSTSFFFIRVPFLLHCVDNH